MKVSLNWIKQYVDNLDSIPVEALVDRIGAQLGAVEETVNIGQKYQGIVIAKVVSCQDHPDADRLHVCLLDDGGATQDVTRDQNGRVQVVCGAPNVREGLLVAWLPPGTVVPDTFDKEPFKLEARELRGVMSNGMLASARELAIGDSHEGILEVDVPEARPGTPFVKAYELDDYIIDIENKMFTHRPDCFGQLGVAREIAGISGKSFYSPDWYLHSLTDELTQDGAPLPLSVHNELPAEVPRFMAVAMSGVQIKPSPLWLQSYLSRLGVRPINNVVDITNYMMLLTGQPLHAYDYDKVKAQDPGADSATLVARYPHPDEKITLLNGKQIAPRAEAIMIATNNTLIGVGGVMGGFDTEVDEHTTGIILECATFDMYSIRRTAMAHGLFTDAVTRNTKGQSPLQNDRVLAKTVAMLRDQASAQVASPVIDDNHLDQPARHRDSLYKPVKVAAQFINERLGLELAPTQMATLLTNVEFVVQQEGDDLIVTAPFWRTDIEIPEDVVEEIGRLYGFDHLPKVLPHRDMAPATKDPLLALKTQLRYLLQQAGANETLSYSFVHGKLLQNAGQAVERAFQLANALSPDLQYYRMSLTPSLLDKVHANIKAGYDEFALFEIGKTHQQEVMDQNENDLPAESNRLSLVYANKHQTSGAAYFQARYFLDYLLTKVHDCYVVVGWDKLSPTTKQALQGQNVDLPDYAALAAPFDLVRSGFVVNKSEPDGLPVAIAGEFRTTVAKAFKLPEKCAGFEIMLDSLQPPVGSQYQAASRFPKLEQDLCLKVPFATSYSQVVELAENVLRAQLDAQEVTFSLAPIDIYQRPDEPDHKQITVRLTVASYVKTMTDDEVSRLLDNVTTKAEQELHASRV